jgi:hypothetical protein
VSVAARTLATRVGAVDEAAWIGALAELSAGSEPPTALDGPPTYHEIVSAGLDLVTALVADSRWLPARTQVELLAEWCARHRKALHPVAVVAFEGLETAVRAHDDEETAAHLELLAELFPAPADER